jgi:hypothetical protein
MAFSSKLKKVSNPIIAERKAKQYLGSNVKLLPSKSKGKNTQSIHHKVKE